MIQYINNSVALFVGAFMLQACGLDITDNQPGRGSVALGGVVVALGCSVALAALWGVLWLGFALGFTM